MTVRLGGMAAPWLPWTQGRPRQSAAQPRCPGRTSPMAWQPDAPTAPGTVRESNLPSVPTLAAWAPPGCTQAAPSPRHVPGPAHDGPSEYPPCWAQGERASPSGYPGSSREPARCLASVLGLPMSLTRTPASQAGPPVPSTAVCRAGRRRPQRARTDSLLDAGAGPTAVSCLGEDGWRRPSAPG